VTSFLHRANISAGITEIIIDFLFRGMMILKKDFALSASYGVSLVSVARAAPTECSAQDTDALGALTKPLSVFL
jgi:hypothetical protein